jgi:hypothetical protein
MRQDENLLIEATNELAWGRVSSTTIAFLKSLQRPLNTQAFKITHLCALNLEVDIYNAAMLSKVQTVSQKYTAEDSGDQAILNKMTVEKVCIWIGFSKLLHNRHQLL